MTWGALRWVKLKNSLLTTTCYPNSLLLIGTNWLVLVSSANILFYKIQMFSSKIHTTEKTIKMAAKTIGLSHDCVHFKISVTKGRGGTNIFSRDTTWAYLVHAVQAWHWRPGEPVMVTWWHPTLGLGNIRDKCDGDLGTPPPTTKTTKRCLLFWCIMSLL